MLIHRHRNSGFYIPHSAFRIPHLRDGFTLAEVLIALFVLAIGMMGILALFPLGAAQMAIAVKDERCAQMADLGEAHARMMWRKAWLIENDPDPTKNGQLKTDTQATTDSPELLALDGPNALSTYSSPSMPVLIDPIGYPMQSGNSKTWVGGQPNVLARRSIQSLSVLPIGARGRMCGLLDDMTFNNRGEAKPVNRGGRYNCAFLIQRPKNNLRHEVNVKVVVYQNRPVDSPASELVLAVPLSATPNIDPSGSPETITIASNGLSQNALRKGSWLLVASPGAAGFLEPFADFYRVTGVNLVGSYLQFNVSPPVRKHSLTGGAYSAYVYYMENVVEVFDRGTITPYGVPAS